VIAASDTRDFCSVGFGRDGRADRAGQRPLTKAVRN